MSSQHSAKQKSREGHVYGLPLVRSSGLLDQVRGRELAADSCRSNVRKTGQRVLEARWMLVPADCTADCTPACPGWASTDEGRTRKPGRRRRAGAAWEVPVWLGLQPYLHPQPTMALAPCLPCKAQVAILGRTPECVPSVWLFPVDAGKVLETCPRKQSNEQLPGSSRGGRWTGLWLN